MLNFLNSGIIYEKETQKNLGNKIKYEEAIEELFLFKDSKDKIIAS